MLSRLNTIQSQMNETRSKERMILCWQRRIQEIERSSSWIS